jgi:hypothetical protein
MLLLAIRRMSGGSAAGAATMPGVVSVMVARMVTCCLLAR